MALIVKIIQRYSPGWLPPEDTGREWISCLCAFHDDENKSAAVSFQNNAFRCHGCSARGGVISLIRQQEGVSYPEAKRISTEVSVRCGIPVPDEPARLPRREVLGDKGSGNPIAPRGSGRGKQVRSGVRRRSLTRP